MLYEEQAAELLRRCEAIAGRSLPQVRGNLRKAPTRAEAVWEMLVLEAASKLGQVECEAPGGGPDIRLLMPTGRWVSIEVTYLHPRFEADEDRCSSVTHWMAAAEREIGPQRVAIECDFRGGVVEASGTKLKLPAENERRKFLSDPDVVFFINAVKANPLDRHSIQLTNYTVTLSSRPRLSDSDRFTMSSRPALEAPTEAEEHAAFRSLRQKIAQHKVDEPHVVCIGSDVSRVLRNDAVGFEVRLRDALGAAVRQSGRLSAVMTVPIETHSPILAETTRRAKITLHQVPHCRYPLTAAEVSMLASLNLNQWKYTFPLPRREVLPKHRRPRVGGSLTMSHTRWMNVKMAIPSSVLVDVLAGRVTLDAEYGVSGDPPDRKLTKCLREGWSVVGCRYVDGNIEQALSAVVELELAPPHDPVFWGKSEPRD